MKKVLVIVLALAMVFTMFACGDNNQAQEEQKDTVYKVGMVCIGDENEAYDRNFYMAADAAKAELAKEGINIEWVYKYNEAVDVADYCTELADDGCVAIVCNSYGQEPAMLTVAGDYPETIFVGSTNEGSWKDDLDNTVNAFPSIYEARYLAGIAAGCKLQEMIDNGEIKASEAVIGYVGAYTFAEVISGYTSFFLGARSVCPDATMLVQFIGDWGDPKLEAQAAQDLIDKGAILISQHSDSTTPATTAEANGVFHVGYNIDMSGADVAPNASIISSRIDWTKYYVKLIKAAINGEKFEQDYYKHGLATDEVVLTTLNTKIAAAGTQEKIDAAKKAIIDGSLQVFDTDTFTVGGQKVTSCFALDMDGDFTADTEEAVFDGAFHESWFQSAPYFALRIDGITLVNEAY